MHLCYNICDKGRILSVVESEVNHLGVHGYKEKGTKINIKNTFSMCK